MSIPVRTVPLDDDTGRDRRMTRQPGKTGKDVRAMDEAGAGDCAREGRRSRHLSWHGCICYLRPGRPLLF